ncbi:tannase and feruloyl esterase-domain-containing protein [Aspergillus alliaceus]|uniref:Carboxylic ester hydrolase n=1 Tax=Petromyces alliaceus TaxID=209559 RepID=A0A5N7CEC1_PETAA|nr:tannase and feruloyl esterase-domain-containing protein [Aspergillus alliaceus]
MVSMATVTEFFAATVAQVGNCSSDIIPYSSIPGGQVLDLSAAPDDAVHATVWLPFRNWNNRLQGSGGVGYAMRSEDPVLAAAVAQNYTVIATDGDHDLNRWSSKSRSLDASGNVNTALLENFAYVALGDAATIGKQIAASFYGRAPQYSYRSGCSTGGRQGLMLAQRYPTAYNGIMAAAPAINWPGFLVAEFWPQFVMTQLQVFPPACDLDAITAATIRACDDIDGVVDGVISAPDLCGFDPRTLVGTRLNCSGVGVEITRNNPLVSSLTRNIYSTSLNCTGVPFAISADWISQIVLQDPSFDFTTLDHKALEEIFTRSKDTYNKVIGTEQYYKLVEEKDPSVRDFYRFFEAPGVYHCRGGAGPVPIGPLGHMVDWVENGIAPETGDALAADGRRRGLCPYTLVSVYRGGDVKDATSYRCEEMF